MKNKDTGNTDFVESLHKLQQHIANETDLCWGRTKTNIYNNESDEEHINEPHMTNDNTNRNIKFDHEKPHLKMRPHHNTNHIMKHHQNQRDLAPDLDLHQNTLKNSTPICHLVKHIQRKLENFPRNIIFLISYRIKNFELS